MKLRSQSLEDVKFRIKFEMETGLLKNWFYKFILKVLF